MSERPTSKHCSGKSSMSCTWFSTRHSHAADANVCPKILVLLEGLVPPMPPLVEGFVLGDDLDNGLFTGIASRREGVTRDKGW